VWDATAREARLQAEQHAEERVSFPAMLEMAQKRESVSAGVLRPAKHLRDAPAGLSVASGRKSGKRSQVEKEIEGLRAQESAASRRIEIVREEAATVCHARQQGT